jgi:hypothetical protein
LNKPPWIGVVQFLNLGELSPQGRPNPLCGGLAAACIGDPAC